MKGKRFLGTALAMTMLLVLLAGLAVAQEPAGSPLTAAFTYQGRLKSNDVPYTGLCDFQFGLWDSDSGGTQVGPTQPVLNVGLAEGYFTVVLDWGLDKFQGDARWLDVAVRCPAGGGTYTPLTPRQPLTATPYALYSLSADPLVMQRRVAGTCATGYAIREVLPDGSVTCEAVGGGGDAWLLTGNSGTVPGTNFVGTTDSAALVFKVNNERALRLESTPGSPNVIGGYIGNWAYSGVYGASIGGGGESASENLVTDHYGTVGGGAGNQAGDAYGTLEDAKFATVGGGYLNSARLEGATVGGGEANDASGLIATVSGGATNTAGNYVAYVGGGMNNIASGAGSTVGGGRNNIASGANATVGGGEDNEASADHATVGGGITNTVSAEFATVGGGMMNTASGTWSVIAGGSENGASDLWATVGGGTSNYATGANATVGGGWGNIASGGDSTDAGGHLNVASGTQATVCGGGENTAAGTWSFAAGNNAKANSMGCFVWGDSSNPDITCNTQDRWVARASGGVYFYTNSGATTGSYLAAGSGSWTNMSDRNLKENVAEVEPQALLESLAYVPVTTWNYTSQDDSIRHIGPMAQDFHAAFGVGEDDTHITTVDADGVALAAIQALYARNQALEAQVGDLEARLAALEKAQEPARTGAALPWLLAGGLVVAGGTWAARRRPGGRR